MQVLKLNVMLDQVVLGRPILIFIEVVPVTHTNQDVKVLKQRQLVVGFQDNQKEKLYEKCN